MTNEMKYLVTEMESSNKRRSSAIQYRVKQMRFFNSTKIFNVRSNSSNFSNPIRRVNINNYKSISYNKSPTKQRKPAANSVQAKKKNVTWRYQWEAESVIS